MAVHNLLWTDELPGEFTETSWRPPEGGLPSDQWREALGKIDKELIRAEEQLDSLKWWWGDLVLAGELGAGEEFTQAFDPASYSKGGRGNILYTCRNVKADVRQPPPKLPFYKHTSVAPLKDYPEVQKEILEQAAEEKLTHTEIRDMTEAQRKLLGAGQRTRTSELSSAASVTHLSVVDGGGQEPVIQIADHLDTCPRCGGTGTVPKKTQKGASG